ncbi:GrpB family protein [Parachlamydia sp. AcF125]|uniref:GrpB family protein n=1 Tax=Parachlamydia sp. AcF125 TaxID=2795736 RepID=UPI001BC97404|nr:GrpB family protein [Parachlamydia sp. AcF125]MBS4168988.1 hypothetical protein [Parachlamydia sp. AcF125]
MKQKYVYKPNSDLFPGIFLKEKLRILNVLNNECLDIEHIGSTAIPGLGGKGIIDIGLPVAKNDIESASHKIESLGPKIN